MDKAIDQNNFLLLYKCTNHSKCWENTRITCFKLLFYASQFKYPSVSRVLCYHKE